MAIPTPFRPKQALGFIYVIAGSLHGVNVLRRVWSTSTDHRVLSASNFMDYSDLNAQWARLLGMFNATSFSAADQARIISAAQAAFDIFERAASAVRPEAIEA